MNKNQNSNNKVKLNFIGQMRLAHYSFNNWNLFDSWNLIFENSISKLRVKC